jgi:MFS family permease
MAAAECQLAIAHEEPSTADIIIKAEHPQACSPAEDQSKITITSPDAVSTPATPYTTFTPNNKRLLSVLIGLATITSPLTATIYMPLLPLPRTHFHVSSQAINLTLTIYIIFQGVSPAVFGPLSDSLGRRPLYLLTLSIYMLGNLGLALNRSSYGVLLGLRSPQSLGASAAFAVSYGVVADVCVPSERGKMMGRVSMALNLGTCVGPIVGGFVAYTSGTYQGTFWALVIVGGVLILSVGGLLPETARSVVGNGSERRSWWEESWWTLIERQIKGSNKACHVNAKDGTLLSRRKFRPLDCLRIIFYRDTFLCLWMHGSFYAVDYSLVAAVPDIYKGIYHFNELQIGLSYLPRGGGIILGGYCNGKLMDYNYRYIAKKLGWTVDRVSGDDLARFPIERARSRGSVTLLAISTATLVGYGWAANRTVHVSIPLILQFIEGFWGTCFYTTYNTLLVDMFPESPSTAAATSSITRCAMAAASVAILQPLLNATGRGWYFTLLGIWSGSCGGVVVYLIRRKGMEWRRERSEREQRPE